MFWQSLLLARSRLCFCELAVYREAIFLPEFESLSCSELNIYIYIYIFFFLVVYLSATAQNMDEEGSPPPPSWKTEIQGLFASLKQDLRQEIEAKFRVLDGPESNEDESSNGDEESTEVSPALTSCLADYLGDAPKSSFDNLAEEFSTADKTSAPVNAKLATMIEELIKGNLPKAKLEQLVEKYPRPENCKLLVSPKVNRAIWNQLSPSTKSSDRALQKAQQLFIFSIYATINACEKASDELKASLAHSLVLALAGNRELNLRRRESLKPDLNAQFASLCNQTTPITSELFGDDLGKEIDEVSRANKVSRKLSSKRSSPRGYQPYNAQHRQRSSSFSRRGKPYSTRPFLGEKSSYSKKARRNLGSTGLFSI